MAKQPNPSFILVPGAGGMAWYWHRVGPLLEQAGCESIAVDLPADDAGAGLNEYVDTVIRAVGKRSNVTLVAQSLGGSPPRWSATAWQSVCLSSSMA